MHMTVTAVTHLGAWFFFVFFSRYLRCDWDLCTQVRTHTDSQTVLLPFAHDFPLRNKECTLWWRSKFCKSKPWLTAIYAVSLTISVIHESEWYNTLSLKVPGGHYSLIRSSLGDIHFWNRVMHYIQSNCQAMYHRSQCIAYLIWDITIYIIWSDQ